MNKYLVSIILISMAFSSHPLGAATSDLVISLSVRYKKMNQESDAQVENPMIVNYFMRIKNISKCDVCVPSGGFYKKIMVTENKTEILLKWSLEKKIDEGQLIVSKCMFRPVILRPGETTVMELEDTEFRIERLSDIKLTFSIEKEFAVRYGFTSGEFIIKAKACMNAGECAKMPR